MADTVIGIMGPGGNPTQHDLANAYAIGKFAAQKNFVTLTGGMKKGVMDEALRGAKEAGGRTIGILPVADKSLASPHADIVVVTAMGSARNNINVLTSDVVVACGCESGTLSEIALALKADKQVILLTQNQKATDFLSEVGKGKLAIADSADDACTLIEQILHDRR